MIAQGKNLFVAKDCPINTYGAAGKVYGWAAAPCKPCPRNMITVRPSRGAQLPAGSAALLRAARCALRKAACPRCWPLTCRAAAALPPACCPS
jgi:hypothetical protein